MRIVPITGLAEVEAAAPVAVYFRQSPEQAAQKFEETFGFPPEIVFVTSDSVLPPIIYVPFIEIKPEEHAPELVAEPEQNLEDQPSDWFTDKVKPYEQYC